MQGVGSVAAESHVPCTDSRCPPDAVWCCRRSRGKGGTAEREYPISNKECPLTREGRRWLLSLGVGHSLLDIGYSRCVVLPCSFGVASGDCRIVAADSRLGTSCAAVVTLHP